MTIVDEQALTQAVGTGAALASSAGATAGLKLEQAG